MHLCVLCRDLAAHAPSGLSQATSDLSRALAEEGHTVRLLTSRSPVGSRALSGVSVEPLDLPIASGPFRYAAPGTARQDLLYSAAVYREVRRIHEREQPVDAVLAPLWRSEGAICLLDERFPTLVTCMTSVKRLTEIDEWWRLVPDIDEHLALEREALQRCRYLHGLTRADLLRTTTDYHLAPLTTAIIGRGLRDRTAAALHNHNGARPSTPDDNHRPLQLLFVGRIEQRKGVDTLLAAVRELLDDGLDVRLKIAGPDGDPELRLKLRHTAASQPRLARAVDFTGGVSDTDLDQLYAESDVVCVPSRYESHGIVLIEAMMHGKPVVTSDAGGIGEVVDPGRTALVSPPEDASALAAALRRLVADPGRRTELGSAARAAFERRFEARAVARGMESFLTEVLAIHRANAVSAGDVRGGLERLLSDVLAISPDAASVAADELLDPSDGELLRRLRAAARQAPAPTQTPAPDGRGSSSATPDRPRITAVVLTHDRPEQLTCALDSLKSSQAPVEILVIDNGSGPAQARRVEACCSGRDGVRLHREDRNLGTAGGRLLASELVESELVLFLDDDAELLPMALDHLLAELDAHPSAGAVTATVVSSDGLVSHSGGSLDRAGDVVTFGLIGSGIEFDPEAVPPSGPAAWVPGTAVLVRRELLVEFPIDGQMAPYFEDNEWCYRIALDRPDSFRRCREALAFHRLTRNVPQGKGLATTQHRVALLAAAARFYRRHGVMLGPPAFDGFLPELLGEDGTRDFASARLLMELLAVKRTEWMVAAWNSGELEALLSAHRPWTELKRLKLEIAAQEEKMQFLYNRHQILCRVEQGGWWRLRGRILPLIRFASAVRRGLRRLTGADE